MRFNRSIKLGDEFMVRVAYADPHKDEIQFQEVFEAIASG
jgi:hypothetical protein